MSSLVIVGVLCLVLVRCGAAGLAAGQNSSSGRVTGASSLLLWKAIEVPAEGKTIEVRRTGGFPDSTRASGGLRKVGSDFTGGAR